MLHLYQLVDEADSDIKNGNLQDGPEFFSKLKESVGPMTCKLTQPALSRLIAIAEYDQLYFRTAPHVVNIIAVLHQSQDHQNHLNNLGKLMLFYVFQILKFFR